MVRPASVMMLSVRLSAQENSKAARIEVGRETAVTSVARKDRKNRKIMRIARAPPMRTFSTSPLTDSSTSSAELKTTSTSSSPRSSRTSSSAPSTPLATSTVLASGSLVMLRLRLGSPLVREMPAISAPTSRTSAISPRSTGS